jgi:hypothetical protein
VKYNVAPPRRDGAAVPVDGGRTAQYNRGLPMPHLHSMRPVVLAVLLGLSLAALGAAAFADSSGARPAGNAAGYAPDPAAQPSNKQWVFEVAYTKGKTSIPGARPVLLERPAATARRMGRFAIELYVGKELLDRIRFDVPLTGDAPDKRSGRLFPRPTFDEGVTTRVRVQMADNPRATYAKLIDRQTGAEQRFSWPPEPDGQLLPVGAPPSAAAGMDAGAPGDAETPGDAGAAQDAGDAARHQG